MSLVFWRKFIPTTQPSSTWKAVSSWSLRKLRKSLSGRFKDVAHFQATCWLKVKFFNQDGGPPCQDLPHLLLLNSSRRCGRLPARIPVPSCSRQGHRLLRHVSRCTTGARCEPGAPPARPSGLNRHALLKCERE